MEKFSTSKDGYNKEEVNKFVNDVVTEVESMLNKMKQKDKEISELTKSLEKYDTDTSIFTTIASSIISPTL